MVVPPPCGKLQSWRGLGFETPPAAGVVSPGAKRRVAAGAAAVSLAAGLAAMAQEPARPRSDLLVSSAVERIAAAPAGDGTAAAPVAADTAAAHADQLIVSVRFTNATDRLLDSIRITSAVPAGVQYVPRSAGGPGSDALFSVDNGRSFARPEELTLAAPGGGVRAAAPADYTHVRWVLRAPLDAGATGIVRFRAVPR